MPSQREGHLGLTGIHTIPSGPGGPVRSIQVSYSPHFSRFQSLPGPTRLVTKSGRPVPQPLWQSAPESLFLCHQGSWGAWASLRVCLGPELPSVLPHRDVTVGPPEPVIESTWEKNASKRLGLSLFIFHFGRKKSVLPCGHWSVPQWLPLLL